MSKQQLYINDVAVDMPSDEIKIKVASNILSDVSKVVTAHSYSLTLPRTLTNDNIFALAYVVGADTGGKSTHRYLKASLYMDGVPLFEDGRAVLNKVDENGYNLNLFWGLLEIFDKIKEDDLNLCDLPASPYWDESLSQWVKLVQYDDTLPQYLSGMSDSIYNNLDSESKELADKYPWILPTVSAGQILTTIRNVYGIHFSYSDRAASILSSIYHPLTTLRSMAKGEECIVNAKIDMWEVSSGNYLPAIVVPLSYEVVDVFTLVNMSWANLPLPDFPPQALSSTTNEYIANSAVTLNTHNSSLSSMGARGNIKVKSLRVFGTAPTNVTIRIPNSNGTAITGTYVSPNNYTYDVTINEAFSCKYGERIFTVQDEFGEYSQTYQYCNLNVQFVLEEVTDVVVNSWWEKVRNYPSMKVLDYLKELLAHIGGCIVGSVTKRNSVYITTYNEIFSAEPENVDMVGLKSIEMSLDDVAQKNIYQHKENDDVGTKDTADGVIYCNDTTLELENVAFDSKFKVPLRYNVALWDVEWNQEDSEYNAKWNNAGDYISGLQEGYLSGSGQRFDYVISANYSEYEQAVRYPKVIEVVVRLGILDLLALDFTKPIYINQLASSFVIIEISSDKNEQYNLKLIQI